MFNPPKLRSFVSWINLETPGQSKLIVSGEGEMPSDTERPHLCVNMDPRTPPSTLELDLTIRNSGGAGNAKDEYQRVRFEAPAEQGQYDKVLILWQSSVLLDLDVRETH